MDAKIILEEYSDYLSAVLARSDLTIKEYNYDLLQFFLFMLRRKKIEFISKNEEPTKDDILVNFNLDDLKEVKLSDLYAFIAYMRKEKNASIANRSRKIACLRSFFKFLSSKVRYIDHNPAEELESPKQAKRQAKYLEMEESIKLLDTVLKETHQRSTRDYCIIVLFLNCGLRLAELCSLKISDWQDNHLRVIGKGNKERLVYLNKACINALQKYLDDRKNMRGFNSEYLFLSRQANQLSRAAVQLLVKKYLQKAGLDTKKMSTHKLRHTAATLMYKYGEVDIRTLQHILGHSSVSTTEIYTHLDKETLEDAISRHPLAQIEN